MPGIDLKRICAGLGPRLEAIWRFVDACLNNPLDIAERGLAGSGALNPASTKGTVGFIWAAFVWFATLPFIVLIYFTLLVLALPFIFAWYIWWLVKWPFTPRRPKPQPAPSAQPDGVSWVDTLATIPPGGSRLQYLWRIPLWMVLIPLLAFFAELAKSLFLWIILLGFGMWVLLMLGILFVSGSLFGFGVMINRDNGPTAGNSFTTVCNYRSLTQRDMISMTFDTRVARDAFSCPAFKRMGKSKP